MSVQFCSEWRSYWGAGFKDCFMVHESVTAQIGPMPGGGWGYSGAGTVQGDEYEALNSDEATRTLLEVYQGKYHRDSYQDRVAALAKDGIFLCRQKGS